MNKTKIFSTLLILLLAALPFLTACQSIIPVQAKASESEIAVSSESADFDYDQAADILAYRWVSMARFYEAKGLLNNKMAPADLRIMVKTFSGKSGLELGPGDRFFAGLYVLHHNLMAPAGVIGAFT